MYTCMSDCTPCMWYCVCVPMFLCACMYATSPCVLVNFTVLFMQVHVQIKFPEPTKLGLEFLKSKGEEPFSVYPEADMLLSMNKSKSYSSFTEWGKGWADPEIRRQRLERMRQNRKPDGSRGSQKQRKPRASRKSRSRKSKKNNQDLRTVRGRIEAKLSKYK
jgi:Werner syndrome ATP-dependent helicase